MKSLCTFVFVLFFFTINAQTIYFNNNEFLPALIELNSGEKMEGFVKDFKQPRGFMVSPMGSFGKLEDNLTVKNNKISFKKEEKGSVEKVDVSTIKRIEFKGEMDNEVFEHLKIKSIKKGKIMDDYRDVFVPLIREGKLNLYGAFISVSQGGQSQVVMVMTYIKKPGDEFGYAPVDFENLTLFSGQEAAQEGFSRAIETVGRDCPAFVEKMKLEMEKMNSKEERKKMLADYATTQKEIAEASKKGKTKEDREAIANEYQMNYMLKGYLEMMHTYDTTCP